MREIKFRAWTGNRMIYPEMFDGIQFLNNDTDCNAVIYRAGLKGQSYDCIFVKVMQYTGLKDKNGKEIYEGDAVKFKERLDPQGIGSDGDIKTGIITFQGTRFCICTDGVFYDSRDIPLSVILIKVIGNIYENPELLEIK